MVLEKDTQESEEEIPVEVLVDVYTNSQNVFTVQLGYCPKEQLNNIHNLIRGSFETLATTRSLTFVDRDGTSLHFNTEHVACIKVRVR